MEGTSSAIEIPAALELLMALALMRRLGTRIARVSVCSWREKREREQELDKRSISGKITAKGRILKLFFLLIKEGCCCC